jgi:hypothetical protein
MALADVALTGMTLAGMALAGHMRYLGDVSSRGLMEVVRGRRGLGVVS